MLQNLNGVPVEYDRGRIVFKNSIDRLKFLLNHKDKVAEIIGTTPGKIFSNRRNLQKVSQYIAKIDNMYELGNLDYDMQMYISKHSENTGILDQ